MLRAAKRNGRESSMDLDSPLWIRDNARNMGAQCSAPDDSLLQLWTLVLKNRWETYNKWALVALIMWYESHGLDVSDV